MRQPNHGIAAKLLDEFIQDYLNNRKLSVVRQANATLPIVWFGNSRAYYASRQKIVTIGLNPSWREFSEPRFDMSIDFRKPDAKHRLSMTLDQYFEDNPYWFWFKRFETVLNLLKASYKESPFKNRALHIDIHSSIATKPTWGNSQFRESDRNRLRRPDLFGKLLAALSPDILLFSVNEAVRKEIFGDFNEVDSSQYEKADGTTVRGVHVRLYRRGRMQLLSGRNMQGTPFGGMSDTWLRKTIPTLQWMPATTV